MVLVFCCCYQPISSLVCEHKSNTVTRSESPTNDTGSFYEVLRKKSSFKRTLPTDIELLKEKKTRVKDQFNFNKCKRCFKYFIDGKPPSLIMKIKRRADIKHICQMYKSEERFASVFDKKFHIPLYSAYKIAISGKEAVKSSKTWKIEPQLEDDKVENDEMIMIGDYKKLINNQAVHDDYENSGWERGHLFPKAYTVRLTLHCRFCAVSN